MSAVSHETFLPTLSTLGARSKFQRPPVRQNELSFHLLQKPSERTIVERNPRPQDLLLPVRDRLIVLHRIHHCDSLDSDELLEIDDPLGVPIRMFEAANKVRSVRVARKQRPARAPAA